MTPDILVRGGFVIDPAQERSGRYDVAIKDGRVAAVARNLESSAAHVVIDASRAVVTPGLIDLHTHVYDGGTYWGVDPDAIAWRSGVTTWVDAGSAGAYNLAAFLESVRNKAVRVLSFLNIGSAGLVAEGGELLNLAECDAELCAAVVRRNRDRVRGIKCRIDSSAGSGALEALDRALTAATDVGVPVMVHIGQKPPELADVLQRMRAGDIVTHCATGNSMALVTGSGEVRRSARAAKERGVLFDVGHGAGSFSFDVAQTLLQRNFPPDTISSDAHQLCVRGPMFDLPTCMTKFLTLGMPLVEVVRAVTSTPAHILGLDNEIGSLAVGMRGDLAIFERRALTCKLYDVHGGKREAHELLINTMTLAEGQPLVPRGHLRAQPWVAETPAQRKVSWRCGWLERTAWAEELSEPEAFVWQDLPSAPGRASDEN